MNEKQQLLEAKNLVTGYEKKIIAVSYTHL